MFRSMKGSESGKIREHRDAERVRSPTEHIDNTLDSYSLEGYIPGLRRYFSKRVAAGEIDDLIQEVFVRIRSHRSSQPIERLDRYLFTVAASVLTDRARRRAVRHENQHESLQENHHPAEELTPERVLLSREALELVIEAIADLPGRTRDIFVLHRFEEMSCVSIAEQLGVSTSAVEKHIMKALRVLHARLEATDVDPNPSLRRLDTAMTDQAAAWFARRRSGSWSSADHSAFVAWLNADPLHPAAWSSVERLWMRIDDARDDPAILAIRERAQRTIARNQAWRRAWRGGALAASLVFAILVWRSLPRILPPPMHSDAIASAVSGNSPPATLVRDASTDVGERSFLVLPDGSRVTLNTASTVHADYSGPARRVVLIRGEAYFDVAKDPTRPFVVSAGSRQIIAVGTAFDVRLKDSQVKVTLVEGKVSVVHALHQAEQRPDVMLEAGSALVAPDEGVDHVERLDALRATSWRNGRLVFEGEKLADVVAEMNRYSREQLEITDPALRERRVSGVFEPAGGIAFAKALEAYGIVAVTQRTATTIVLDSPN